jgi:arginine decarboxylase-like protein
MGLTSTISTSAESGRPRWKQTSFESSANYTLQEFANDVVYTVKTVCARKKPEPNIITGGRPVAYHAFSSPTSSTIETVQGIKNVTVQESPGHRRVERPAQEHDLEEFSSTTMTRSSTRKSSSHSLISAT